MILIENDLFDIANRLREIDGGYFILYDKFKKRYEVHNKNQHGGTFCVSVPYNELDERTVRLVKSTRREYADSIIKEIEKNNDGLNGY